MKSVIMLVMIAISNLYYGAVTFLQEPPVLPPEPKSSGFDGEPGAPIDSIVIFLMLTSIVLIGYLYKKRKLVKS